MPSALADCFRATLKCLFRCAMKKLTDLEYLRLNTFQRLWYNIVQFILGIPQWFVNLGKAIVSKVVGFFVGIKNEIVDIVTTFTKGSWKTKVSFLVMGFGNLARGQILRGLLFLRSWTPMSGSTATTPLRFFCTVCLPSFL